ncbi:hypothetical protein Tco_0137558, partial [Tanacetum coccineum]
VPSFASSLINLESLSIGGQWRIQPRWWTSITAPFGLLNILYYGNSMPEWFENRNREHHVKVELPSDWCYDKFRGYATCVAFKCKKPFKRFERIDRWEWENAKSFVTFSLEENNEDVEVFFSSFL